MARLDAHFDPNDRKYYITPQSVERAIEEEKAKMVRHEKAADISGNLPHAADETTQDDTASAKPDGLAVESLQKEVLDLKILNKGKDFLIEQLKIERDGFFAQLLDASRKVGELETRVLQLGGAKDSDGDLTGQMRTS